MSYKNILYEKDGHVVTITINRPEVHNCINWETAKELQKVWQTFRDDKDAFVAIMTGAGDKLSAAVGLERRRLRNRRPRRAHGL